MTSNSLLSEKQLKILRFIETEIARTGRSPTYRDIANHFEYDSVGTVQDHIRALMKKGYLDKASKVARGIQLAYRSQAIQIPILGTVPAGKPIEAIETTRGTLSIPTRWSNTYTEDVYALQVTGESMKDAGILDGDYVIVKKQSHAQNGEIVVAMIDGEVTVKYLEKKRDSVRLLPANPKFSPIELKDQAVIQGKVIGVQRYL